MDKLLKLLQTLIVLVILGLLIWFIFFRVPEGNEELKQYWEAKDFKTDTVHLDVDYSKLPRPIYRNYVPPQVIIDYKAPAIDNKISINLNDSLIQVIDSLQNQIINISRLYLQLYPTASKLIYGTFSEDTIKLDLLSTDGRLFTSVYPVSYARFQYQYKEGNFFANPVDRKDPYSKGMYGVLYGYAGYGVAHKATIAGLDYSLYKGKIRLGVSTFLTIESKPEFTLNGTIGYKLYGR